MAESKLSGFASDATGLISSRLRRKMRNQYYQNKDLKELNQPAASIPLAYKSRNISSSIDFLNQIIYEAEKELKKEKPYLFKED